MIGKKLIIDTNLLLLLVIGAVENGRFISLSKRLGGYCEEDYQSVVRIMGSYEEVFVTPYIAAEVSNLIDLSGNSAISAFHIARNLLSIFNEIRVNIKEDCASEAFLKFGLTDNSLINLSDEYHVLTNDKRLYSLLNPENIVPFFTKKEITW
ncbi:hypothetical protein [Vogesella mureinivorans]|uniref:hypothetical protein n=1 Tax=Vogesella mureinivorans TaxID=657276 RepID=UPI0011CB943B|nr:hypothetical protein [Vogesella mureinivorans]